MSDDVTRVMSGTTQMGTGVTQQMPASGVSGVTQQMPVGGLSGDPYRTQMGGTTTCPVCKSATPLMDIYCGECGYLLSSPAENLEVPQEEAPAGTLLAIEDGQLYKLRQGVNTLGRQGTDILVNDGTISRVHARITIDGKNVTVEDMGSTNGTKVGDRRIGPNQPTPAPAGTTLKFGNWRAILEVGVPPAAAPASPTILGGDRTMAMPGTTETPGADTRTLVGVPIPGDLNPADAPRDVAQNATVVEPAIPDGDLIARLTPISGPGVPIDIAAGTILIGRRPTNTIVISNDAYISGRHAQLETDNTGTYLTDLGSTNGTSVNGQKLTANERQLLLEGDEIQLGQTKYLFGLAEEATQTPTSVPATATPPVTDTPPPGQEFGAINDPVYPPNPRPQEVYHAIDNEVPEA